MIRSLRTPLIALAVILLAIPLAAQTDNSANPPKVPVSPQSHLVAGAGSITTVFANNNQFAGNTFDLENISAVPITIGSFDINCTSTSPPDTVTVYWKVGTAVGSESNAGAWTLLGTDSNVVCAGADAPTPVAVGGLTLAPGDLFGFYVDLASYTGGVSALLYTNGGPNIYSNAEVQLTSNSGQASPAFTTVFFPRIWNGTVYYDVVPVELQSFDVE